MACSCVSLTVCVFEPTKVAPQVLKSAPLLGNTSIQNLIHHIPKSNHRQPQIFKSLGYCTCSKCNWVFTQPLNLQNFQSCLNLQTEKATWKEGLGLENSPNILLRFLRRIPLVKSFPSLVSCQSCWRRDPCRAIAQLNYRSLYLQLYRKSHTLSNERLAA